MRIGLLGGTLALSVLGLPSPASAKPGYIRLPPTFSLQVQLPRSNGYRLSLFGIDHRLVYVTASRQESSATYWTRGFANRHRLDADLGRFGKIDVRLGPMRTVVRRREFGNCRGRPRKELRGVARGTIRFRGLGDFVSTSVHQAKASVTQTFEQVCKREPGTSFPVVTFSNRHRLAAPGRLPHLPSPNVLSARADLDGERVEFSASSLPGLGGFFTASTSQRVGRVSVDNSAFGIFEGGEFAITQGGAHPTAAVVRGAEPLSGESWFFRSPGGISTWSGSLQVEMPGEGFVPLSGPGFHAELCRGSISKALDGCQPSGSQAQSLSDTRLSWSR